jgi:hypothetical protein
MDYNNIAVALSSTILGLLAGFAISELFNTVDSSETQKQFNDLNNHICAITKDNGRLRELVDKNNKMINELRAKNKEYMLIITRYRQATIELQKKYDFNYVSDEEHLPPPNSPLVRHPQRGLDDWSKDSDSESTD